MSQRWGGAHKGFPKHLDTILNWTGVVDNIDLYISLAKQVELLRLGWAHMGFPPWEPR